LFLIFVIVIVTEVYEMIFLGLILFVVRVKIVIGVVLVVDCFISRFDYYCLNWIDDFLLSNVLDDNGVWDVREHTFIF
jgi:hypothetical protein